MCNTGSCRFENGKGDCVIPLHIAERVEAEFGFRKPCPLPPDQMTDAYRGVQNKVSNWLKLKSRREVQK